MRRAYPGAYPWISSSSGNGLEPPPAGSASAPIVQPQDHQVIRQRAADRRAAAVGADRRDAAQRGQRQAASRAGRRDLLLRRRPPVSCLLDLRLSRARGGRARRGGAGAAGGRVAHRGRPRSHLRRARTCRSTSPSPPGPRPGSARCSDAGTDAAVRRSRWRSCSSTFLRSSSNESPQSAQTTLAVGVVRVPGTTRV